MYMEAVYVHGNNIYAWKQYICACRRAVYMEILYLNEGTT